MKLNSNPSPQDSETLEDRLRAQEQVLRDLQLAQARFLEKYRETMAHTAPAKSLPDGEPSD